MLACSVNHKAVKNAVVLTKVKGPGEMGGCFTIPFVTGVPLEV
jgi:hypothetical protein